MELNHVNLPVADVVETRRFLEKYFGLKCAVDKGDKLVGLRDGNGMSVVLSNFDGAKKVEYPEWFHVGFRQGDDVKVDEIYKRLKSDDIDVGERKDMHGAWAFYFTAPGGFMIEVSHQRTGGEHADRGG